MIRLLGALACGLLQAASFAPTGLWWLQPLSLAGLAWLAWDQPWRRAALLGGAFGLAWFAAGLWWLYISLHDFGGLVPPLAVGAVALLAAFLALYPAAAAAGFAAVPARAGLRPLGFACAWLLAELARASWFTGFPWIAGGYAHSLGPLAAWAPWIGVYGMGFMSALLAGGLALLARERRGLPLLLAGLLAGAGLLLPQEFTQPAGRLKLTLLQPNVPQSQKFDPALIEANLQQLLQQIEAARSPLVITPESVLPLPLDYLPAEAQQRLRAASSERTVWLGTFLGSDEQGWVNSMLALQGGEAVHDYGKRHLLPFGEFIPPGFDWFVKALNIPIDSQRSGRHQKPLKIAGLRLRPLICYEDLFGEDFAEAALDGEAAAHVFVNTSNLAWFGPRMVQDQHLQQSQLRALEF
ncbi:MAG: apolipoprotein N-acyltransferase, partial [Inhella sp.]